MEINCEGPVLIRVSPYMEYHTKPLCGQTEPLRTPKTYNHCVTLMENNSQGPVLIRVSPYMEYHTEPLCGQTEALRKSNTRNQLCDTTGTQLSGPRFLQKVRARPKILTNKLGLLPRREASPAERRQNFGAVPNFL